MMGVDIRNDGLGAVALVSRGGCRQCGGGGKFCSLNLSQIYQGSDNPKRNENCIQRDSFKRIISYLHEIIVHILLGILMPPSSLNTVPFSMGFSIL